MPVCWFVFGWPSSFTSNWNSKVPYLPHYFTLPYINLCCHPAAASRGIGKQASLTVPDVLRYTLNECRRALCRRPAPQTGVVWYGPHSFATQASRSKLTAVTSWSKGKSLVSTRESGASLTNILCERFEARIRPVSQHERAQGMLEVQRAGVSHRLLYDYAHACMQYYSCSTVHATRSNLRRCSYIVRAAIMTWHKNVN